MNTGISLQRSAIESGIDKVWGKLSREPKDMGDNVHYWEWTQGVGMYGVIKAYEGTKQERYEAFLRQWAEINAGKIRYGSVNWVIPANVLHVVHLLTGDTAYLQNCRDVADWCVNGALRTTNGGFAHVWGPGAGGLDDYKNQLWIDTLFMTGIFMLRYGVSEQDGECINEALRQFDIHIDCQFDTSCDLFYHGYHCLEKTTLGEHWGRGNGWAVVSIVELLDILHGQAYDTERFSQLFKRHMKSAIHLRMENGMLRTLLDFEESYLETSASALFAYAAMKGHRLGLLEESYRIWGEQVTNEILTNHLDEDGTVLHASGGTDCQEREGYLKVPYQSRQYNAGIVLMLLSEALLGREGER
ncbi:glycoside hydrolase family 88 protein [Paenibacillus sp. LHD-38]|uniref:glycoside hydrolase family 88 protein n=1 Tax=Paenibacillus sp. LHD-38 TaxID=3072143 RepID=UPI00280EA488|nr:glycoside hydrolase family 88 protein [Paenibacillus sp. LHD-38]MDQ8734752.1 glycoside hydrolase family 88 protein [Paenibacillus sp. LHD-38]